MAQGTENIPLPSHGLHGRYSLEQLLERRRSVREFAAAGLSLADLGQLLWAAQGITDPAGLRTAPSAGALYPLELYVVAGRVDGLEAGIYHYKPGRHRLVRLHAGDARMALAGAALGQRWIGAAPAVVVFGADYARTERKYGARAERYVHIEAGHAAQNLFLQAEDLGLATVVVGAFHDHDVARLLDLPRGVAPLLLMPVGHPAGPSQ